MVKTSGFFKNSRGQKLYTAEWIPEEGDVNAVIFWNHGFGEYIDRFDASFKAWNAAGIAVFGFDAHGMGLSEPLDDPSRALIRRFSFLVDDVLKYLDEVLYPALKTKNIAAPIIVGGDSLGGLVAAYVALERPNAFAGLVMQSPAIDVEWNPLLRFQAAVGNLLALLVPKAKLVPAVRPEDMSQDPAVVKEYLEDPIIYKGNVKALSGNEILKAFRNLSAKRKELKLPIFAVHGTSDNCTSLSATRELCKNVSSTDVTLKEVPGGYHELLFGPEKDEVRADIRDWVLAHAEAAKAAAAKEADSAAAAAADPAPVADTPAPAAAEKAAGDAPAAATVTGAAEETKPAEVPVESAATPVPPAAGADEAAASDKVAEKVAEK